MTIKYFSMFTGIGGFEYGIQQAVRDIEQSTTQPEPSEPTVQQRGERSVAQHEVRVHPEHERGALCVGYSEIDKYATSIYRYNYGTEVKNYGDATRIDPATIPDFDLLVGGFPCQAFSLAGKRRGFEDTRGTLFYEIARIAQSKKPRLMVLENVKGLLNHDEGRTFATILGTLAELGYEYQCGLVNSRYFGVPQNRERIIIVCNLRGTPRPEVFPLTGSGGAFASSREPVVVGTIHAGYYKGGGRDQPYVRCGIKTNQRREVTTNDYAGSLQTTPGRSQFNGVVQAVLTPDRLEKRQNGRRIKDDDEAMFTLTAQDKHGVYDGINIRKLTPVECERLQGFPDDWTRYGIDYSGKTVVVSDTQRYKTCGNAVTTNVIRAVMRKVLA